MRPTIDELKIRLDGSTQPRLGDQPVGMHQLRAELAGLRRHVITIDERLHELSLEEAGLETERGVEMACIRALCAEAGFALLPGEEPSA